MRLALLALSVAAATCAPAFAEEEERKVVVVKEAANAGGTYAGSEKHPVPVVRGLVAEIVEKGPPMKLAPLDIPVKLVKAHYAGPVVTGGLVKPTEGGAQEAYVGDMKLTLIDNSVSDGTLNTKEFGRLPVFFSSSLVMTGCVVAFPEKELVKLRKGFGEQADVKEEDNTYTQKTSEVPSKWTDDTVEKLIDRAMSKDEKIADEAKKTLLEAGQAAVPNLVRRLEDKNNTEKATIINVLGDLGPKSEGAVPSLVRILDNEMKKPSASWVLVANAAGALGKIGPAAKSSIPSLISTMSTDGSDWAGDWDPSAKLTAVDVIRGNSISALSDIGVEAAPFLVKELDNVKEASRQGVQKRKNAASALYHIGEPVIPEVVYGLQDENLNAETKSWLLAILGWMGPKAKSAVTGLLEMPADSGKELLPDVAATLKKITGEDFGQDLEAWKNWHQKQTSGQRDRNQ